MVNIALMRLCIMYKRWNANSGVDGIGRIVWLGILTFFSLDRKRSDTMQLSRTKIDVTNTHVVRLILAEVISRNEQRPEGDQ